MKNTMFPCRKITIVKSKVLISKPNTINLYCCLSLSLIHYFNRLIIHLTDLTFTFGDIIVYSITESTKTANYWNVWYEGNPLRADATTLSYQFWYFVLHKVIISNINHLLKWIWDTLMFFDRLVSILHRIVFLLYPFVLINVLCLVSLQSFARKSVA
jgi:hypothetical protein